ncbi:hypothetical protein [Nonomuraea sp. NEAU-A123]|uniref:hypothetical protein n=1 Tax=Nonomuraea sp. NEAU-A123 TaxID=2839649 RepID=UPI001BE4533A|nr:hypothetical protein [Nonomuraea sp. NEAU-A123]MBT2226285.1 hypothetical protein [Nonomuraea sp. NEAU-A123]
MPSSPEERERPTVDELYDVAAREKAEYERLERLYQEQMDRYYEAVKALDAAGEGHTEIGRRLKVKKSNIQYMANTDLEARRARREAKRAEDT